MQVKAKLCNIALMSTHYKLTIEISKKQNRCVELFKQTFDIFQCMDNVHFDHLYNNTIPNASATVVPQFVKSDPSLFKDDVDIRFSRTLNNCKVPQIRYATPERLLQRLTDLRFLSIDFLNTFLLTYRVFADGVQVNSIQNVTLINVTLKSL